MKHNPRLPELGGMTEAGFNRVVAMIQPWDFHHRRRCNTPWGYSGFTYCDECRRAKQRFDEWRASLPKTRNKKQRKAANVPRWTEEDIRKMHERSEVIEAFFELAKSVPVVDGQLAAREWHVPTAQEVLDTLNQGIREAYEQTTKPYVPRTQLQRFKNPVLGVPFELTAEQVAELEREERSHREYDRRKLKGGG